MILIVPINNIVIMYRSDVLTLPSAAGIIDKKIAKEDHDILLDVDPVFLGNSLIF